MRAARDNPLWLAHLLHRLSGLALAVFLPFHFYALGLALQGAGALDSFLTLSALPLVKLAEGGLVFLLAVHFFGGLRILVLEFLPWRAPHKTLAAAALAGSFCVCGGFLLGAFA